jgi:hypothetical protein
MPKRRDSAIAHAIAVFVVVEFQLYGFVLLPDLDDPPQAPGSILPGFERFLGFAPCSQVVKKFFHNVRDLTQDTVKEISQVQRTEGLICSLPNVKFLTF